MRNGLLFEDKGLTGPPSGSSDLCEIISVGKRRDGGTKYWCLAHRADATAKYGKPANKCRYADFPPVQPHQWLLLDPRDYGGGCAVWGSVPPVYDTTNLELETGIHVHARKMATGPKDIDRSYREVQVLTADNQRITIEELDAIYFMVSSTLGFDMKFIRCTYCGYPHLDKDWFAVHPHQRHLCSGCGKTFRDDERAIGNPLAKFLESSGASSRRVVPAKRNIALDQKQFPGGIQIWGSNPAIIWTRLDPEEEGIHLHAYDEAGNRVEDDTFAEVSIDGISLDPALVRTYMAQSALPHIEGRISSLRCARCQRTHADDGQLSFTLHQSHECDSCGHTFQSLGRKKRVVSNPLGSVFDMLGQRGARPPRKHDVGLLPETI